MKYFCDTLAVEEDCFLDMIGFLCAVHDIGKFAEGFQNLRPDLYGLLNNRESSASYPEKHWSLGYRFLRDHTQVMSNAQKDIFFDALDRWLAASARLRKELEMFDPASGLGFRRVRPWWVEEVLREIAPLDPVEVFSEVLNPMDDNVKIMNETLEQAGRKESISELYRTNQWVRWTYEYLYNAYLLARKLGCNFICWPSPHSVKSPLSEEQKQWLLKWIPSSPVQFVSV